MQNLFHSIKIGIVSLYFATGSLFGIQQPPQIQYIPQNLGGTVDQGVAFFETTLANSITSSATSLTLTSATDAAGTTLASSTYGFVIDEGTASQEMIRASCTGTACTGLVRGLNPVNGTSTVSALQKSHRRGASVKITDGPLLLVVSNILAGRDTIPTPIKYDSSISTSTIALDGSNLASVNYANSLSFGAIPPASETVAGFVELATGAEAAAGTSAGGTTYRLALPAVIATSTWNSTSSAANKIPVTGSTGNIAGGFVGSSTNLYNTGSLYTTGTTTLATSSALVNSSNIQLLKFGGTGSDGALSSSSGTTTINCSNAAVCTKNYTSISLTGTAALTISNPNTNGTILVLKSQGNVTLTSSGSAIYLKGLGAAASSYGITSQLDQVNKGGDGAATNVAGSAGSALVPDLIYLNSLNIGVGAGGGAGGTNNVGATAGGGGGGASLVSAGSAGGAGGGGSLTTGAGGAGGAGGGAVYIEARGAYNFTSTINVAGNNGADATGGGSNGGGGGGGGGSVVVLYDSLTADSGTYIVSGGSGGANTANGGAGGAGGAGDSYRGVNTSH